MARRTKHVTWVGATVATALALAAPAAADVRSGPEASPASVAQGTVATGDQPQERAGAATDRGGLDRRDAMLAAAIVAVTLLMGFRGYVVVGAVIAGVAAAVGVGARLVTGRPKRAWSDWHSPAVARGAKHQARAPRPTRRPKAELH